MSDIDWEEVARRSSSDAISYRQQRDAALARAEAAEREIERVAEMVDRLLHSRCVDELGDWYDKRNGWRGGDE